MPTKPYPAGKIHKKPAESPAEVLERARLALAPRGAWRKGGFTGDSKVGGQKRCLIQAINDCDGTQAEVAKNFVVTSVGNLFPKRSYVAYNMIPNFNDDFRTTKIDVLNVLDHAIELAQQEGKKT